MIEIKEAGNSNVTDRNNKRRAHNIVYHVWSEVLLEVSEGNFVKSTPAFPSQMLHPPSCTIRM